MEKQRSIVARLWKKTAKYSVKSLLNQHRGITYDGHKVNAQDYQACALHHMREIDAFLGDSSQWIKKNDLRQIIQIPIQKMKKQYIQNTSASVLSVVRTLAEQSQGIENVITEIFAPITPPRPGNYLIGKKEVLRMLFYELNQWLPPTIYSDLAVQKFRVPARAWNERSSGLELTEILALFSAVLKNSGIVHKICVVRYNQVWCHGYVTVPDHRHPRGYFVLDVFKIFDEEATGFNDSAKIQIV